MSHTWSQTPKTGFPASRPNYGPAHAILVLIAYSQKSAINAHADVSNGAIGLYLGLRLHLHLFFVYAISEGSGESGHMCRLIRAFAARQCDKYQIPMCSYKPLKIRQDTSQFMRFSAKVPYLFLRCLQTGIKCENI